MNNWYYYFLVVVSAFITAFSQILLKKSANKQYESKLREYMNFTVIFAYFLFFGVMIFNIYIYTKVDYKFGIVINSLSTVIVLIFSNLFLNEKVTSRKLIGNILIVLGILCFSYL